MRSALAALVCGALLTPACVVGREGGRPRVVTGTYAMRFLAERIAGVDAEVVDVVPPGAEPHDLELGPAQVAQVEQADLVVVVGGLQPALDDAARGARAFDARAVAGGEDPHVWLDPLVLNRVGERLADRLVSLVPESARQDVRERWRTLSAELVALDERARAALDRCRSSHLVTSHAAFGRFAARYGLRETAIAGVDDEAEPSPRRIADVAAFVRANRVPAVFAESADSRPARTVAREAGVPVEVLDPIEVHRGADYLAVFARNVATVARVLGCR